MRIFILTAFLGLLVTQVYAQPTAPTAPDSISQERDITDRELLYKAELQQTLALLIVELRTKRIQLMLALGAATFFMFFAMVGIRYQRNQRKQEKYRHQLGHRVLQAHLNPHFIGQALTALQQGKGEIAAPLGALIRQAQQHAHREFVALAEEVAMLDNYLKVQQVRFGNRFTYRLEVADTLDPDITRLPPMFAQPFIEHSLTQGTFAEGESHIAVRIGPEEGMLCLEVEDTGIVRADASKHDSLAQATTITEERLDIFRDYYRKNFRLEVSEGRVRLRVPMLEEE